MRSLTSKNLPLVVFGIRSPKYWALGPSEIRLVFGVLTIARPPSLLEQGGSGLSRYTVYIGRKRAAILFLVFYVDITYRKKHDNKHEYKYKFNMDTRVDINSNTDLHIEI